MLQSNEILQAEIKKEIGYCDRLNECGHCGFFTAQKQAMLADEIIPGLCSLHQLTLGMLPVTSDACCRFYYPSNKKGSKK